MVQTRNRINYVANESIFGQFMHMANLDWRSDVDHMAKVHFANQLTFPDRLSSNFEIVCVGYNQNQPSHRHGGRLAENSSSSQLIRLASSQANRRRPELGG